MITADFIAIGIVAFMALMGLLAGFGKCLKFFTCGLFGIIISIIICYLLGVVILKIGFISDLVDKFIAALTDKNSFCDFLLRIRIHLVVYYVALFTVVMVLRAILVRIIKSIAEIENSVIKVLNKIFGGIFMVCVTAVLTLFAFQVISWITEATRNSL